jgi:hypothetical protein
MQDEVPKSLFFKQYSREPLDVLNLSSWGDTVTNTTLSLVATRCGPALTALNLDHCMRWTQDGFNDVCRSCPNLRVLTVTRCIGMNEQCLTWVGQYCRKLTHLCVAQCVNVTSNGLRRLAATARVLQVINLDGCQQVDPSGVAAIAANCKQLRSLRCRDLLRLDLPVAEVLVDAASTRWLRLCVDLHPSRASRSTRFLQWLVCQTANRGCRQLMCAGSERRANGGWRISGRVLLPNTQAAVRSLVTVRG